MTEEKKPKPDEMIIWQIATDMPGTAHERKSYYTTLKDGEKETHFILRLSADGMMVVEPYVVHEYDYDDIHYEDDEEDEDDEWDEYDDEEEEEGDEQPQP